MLSVTTYISTDIAAVPLLWVLPLGIYLVTFVLVFARREIVPHRWMTALLPIAVVPPILTLLIRTGESPDVLIPIHLTVLFVAAMVCHGELVRARPRAADLTGFYLWIATGGVLGGIFSVLVAPLIFQMLL